MITSCISLTSMLLRNISQLIEVKLHDIMDDQHICQGLLSGALEILNILTPENVD